MKKTLLTLTILLAVAALIAAFSSPATAAVSGMCSNCHTMHNSQGGSPMAYDGTGGPFGYLTRGVGSAGTTRSLSENTRFYFSYTIYSVFHPGPAQHNVVKISKLLFSDSLLANVWDVTA